MQPLLLAFAALHCKQMQPLVLVFAAFLTAGMQRFPVGKCSRFCWHLQRLTAIIYSASL
jgi:hypothetical protein